MSHDDISVSDYAQEDEFFEANPVLEAEVHNLLPTHRLSFGENRLWLAHILAKGGAALIVSPNPDQLPERPSLDDATAALEGQRIGQALLSAPQLETSIALHFATLEGLENLIAQLHLLHLQYAIQTSESDEEFEAKLERLGSTVVSTVQERWGQFQANEAEDLARAGSAQ